MLRSIQRCLGIRGSKKYFYIGVCLLFCLVLLIVLRNYPSRRISRPAIPFRETLLQDLRNEKALQVEMESARQSDFDEEPKEIWETAPAPKPSTVHETNRAHDWDTVHDTDTLHDVDVARETKMLHETETASKTGTISETEIAQETDAASKTDTASKTENKTGNAQDTQTIYKAETSDQKQQTSKRTKKKKKSAREVHEENSLNAIADVTGPGFDSSLWGCPNLTYIPPKSDGKYFRNVEGTNTSIYSAYLDGESVRIIAMRTEHDPRLLFCHLWYGVDGQVKMIGIQATVLRIHENDKLQLRFHAAFLLCKIPEIDMQGRYPLAVNVGLKKCEVTRSESLPIQQSELLTSNFTVCVSPIFNFSRAFQLVEMIELSMLLGADKIVFYNHSMDSLVAKILRVYEARGKVDTYVWNIPNVADIHYFGQVVALQDCLHQNRNRARYVVYQDLDEFIVPQSPFKTWSQLIAHRLRYNENAGMFQVRNVFFPIEFQKPWEGFAHNDMAEKFKSRVLRTSFRERHVGLHDVRSKYIVNPRRVSSVGIHNYHHSLNGSLDRVPKEEAMVYHYRATEQSVCPGKCEKDVTAISRFGDELVNRISLSWATLTELLNLKFDALH